MKLSFCFLAIFLFKIATQAEPTPVCVSKYKKVADDLKVYDAKISKMITDFQKRPSDLKNHSWVKEKLQNMFDVDQYMRQYSQTPHQQSYATEETKCFEVAFQERFQFIDRKGTGEIKRLLKIYEWFKISEFGAEADNQAWLIVQHADLDPLSQKSVLLILEKLWPIQETNAKNYAYLFDRVAASWNDPEKRKPQRYGTQGMCKEPSNWQPIDIEAPLKLDDRRAAVGLSSFADYKKTMDTFCH